MSKIRDFKVFLIGCNLRAKIQNNQSETIHGSRGNQPRSQGKTEIPVNETGQISDIF